MKKAAPKKKAATAVIVESGPAVHIEPADTSRADAKLLTRIDQLCSQVDSIAIHHADASDDARMQVRPQLVNAINILLQLTE